MTASEQQSKIHVTVGKCSIQRIYEIEERYAVQNLPINGATEVAASTTYSDNDASIAYAKAYHSGEYLSSQDQQQSDSWLTPPGTRVGDILSTSGLHSDEDLFTSVCRSESPSAPKNYSITGTARPVSWEYANGAACSCDMLLDPKMLIHWALCTMSAT